MNVKIDTVKDVEKRNLRFLENSLIVTESKQRQEKSKKERFLCFWINRTIKS